MKSHQGTWLLGIGLVLTLTGCAASTPWGESSSVFDGPRVHSRSAPKAAVRSRQVPQGGVVAAKPVTTPDTAEPQPAPGLQPPALQPLGLYGTFSTDSSPVRAGDSIDNLKQVSFAAEGADFDPDISPDGQWMVYASTRHRTTSDLYLQRIDGSAVTQLTNDPGNDVMPTFSSDGRRIAFASDRSGNWDIYVMDIDGGQATQISDSVSHDLHPSFSPDGRQLVYCTFGQQSGQWELVLVDLENPATKRFVGYGLFPKWSPKGDRIVFQRARERGTRWFSIWTIDVVNGEARRPTEIAASTNAAAITPRWSPDGEYVVFCTVFDPQQAERGRPRQADVWVTRADGRARANLTNSPFANLQPVWAKDGSIYFVSNRGRGTVDNIWSLRPDRALAAMRGTPVTTANAKLAEPAAAASHPAMEHAAGHQSEKAAVKHVAQPINPADHDGHEAQAPRSAEVPTDDH